MLEAFEEILVGKVRVADRLVFAVPRLADYRSLFESAVRRRSAVPALFRRGGLIFLQKTATIYGTIDNVEVSACI